MWVINLPRGAERGERVGGAPPVEVALHLGIYSVLTPKQPRHHGAPPSCSLLLPKHGVVAQLAFLLQCTGPDGGLVLPPVYDVGTWPPRTLWRNREVVARHLPERTRLVGAK